MAPRAPSGSMTMATRSGPAAGDLSLSELKEFAGFPAATQRYIRRSLDIGLERDDAIARWSRDMVEETAIQIGRASCRERVCKYVYISVVPVTLKKENRIIAQYLCISTDSLHPD